jgi:hypothetical protein
MVAIVSGNGLGLSNSSAALLGQQGLFGGAQLGQAKEKAFVNVANGNLVLQHQDDFLASVGIDQSLTRTYNSQGSFAQDHNGANWHGGLTKRIVYDATANTVVRTDADGSIALYAYDATAKAYLSHDGAGNVKSLTNVGGTWTWRDNANDLYGQYETYDSTGAITAAGDQTGGRLQYLYDSNGILSTVTSVKAGESTTFAYAGGNLSSIQVSAKGTDNVLHAYTRVQYGYDTQNRLTTVTVDLTPDDSVFGTDTYTTTYGYDGDSTRISSVTQDDGSKLLIGYVTYGDAPTTWKVNSLTDALGRKTYIGYSEGRTYVKDPLGHDTVYYYDSLGRLTGVDTFANEFGGAVTCMRYTYDANGNVSLVDDWRGHSVAYVYDALTTPPTTC